MTAILTRLDPPKTLLSTAASLLIKSLKLWTTCCEFPDCFRGQISNLTKKLLERMVNRLYSTFLVFRPLKALQQFMSFTHMTGATIHRTFTSSTHMMVWLIEKPRLENMTMSHFIYYLSKQWFGVAISIVWSLQYIMTLIHSIMIHLE